jgi:DNA primase
MKASGIFYYRENEIDPESFIMMRFNSRLTITIRHVQGEIVGFSARLVDSMG